MEARSPPWGSFPSLAEGFTAWRFVPPSPKGRLRYSVGRDDDDNGASSFSANGTVTGLSFPTATRADLSGTCKLQNGAACTFNVTAEDNGSGGSTDRFTIRVKNALGIVVHEATGTVRSGNIQIK